MNEANHVTYGRRTERTERNGTEGIIRSGRNGTKELFHARTPTGTSSLDQC